MLKLDTLTQGKMFQLDTRVQMKACKVFWHQAEVRMVAQSDHEAPVVVISRPSLLGGQKEFRLQYPAQLEPPTTRNIKRHRFTVRHGRKRRSFQTRDAVTLEKWYFAVKEALEANTKANHSLTSYNVDRNTSKKRRQTAQWKAPVLEHSCFTRDANNWKLIKLRRPAALKGNVGERKKEDQDYAINGISDKHERVSNQMDRFSYEKEAAETGSDLGMIRAPSRVEENDDVDGVMNDNASNLIEYADVAPSHLTVNEVETTVDGVDASSSKFEPLWVPLDPDNSKLIWVRRLMKSEVQCADQRSPRQDLAKQWVPLDPSNSRLLWVSTKRNWVQSGQNAIKCSEMGFFDLRWSPIYPTLAPSGPKWNSYR